MHKVKTVQIPDIIECVIDMTKKLDITIINLTDTNRPTVFSSSNKIGDTDATAPVNKELVFNRTNITINDATQFDTGINLKSGNKYRVTYTATDKAGKTATKEDANETIKWIREKAGDVHESRNSS